MLVRVGDGLTESTETQLLAYIQAPAPLDNQILNGSDASGQDEGIRLGEASSASSPMRATTVRRSQKTARSRLSFALDRVIAAIQGNVEPARGISLPIFFATASRARSTREGPRTPGDFPEA